MKNARDMQSEKDTRNVEIQKVGVKNIKYPILVLDKKNKHQHTVATINMYVDLPHHFKGTHMSRFIEVLNLYHGEISVNNFGKILDEMKETLDAESAHMEVEFPYFIEKAAPVSGATGLVEYNCRFVGASNDEKDFVITVAVPVTSLCPCSKEVSERGAHNQRSIITVNFRFNEFTWIEEIIELVESCASSPIYSILKRPDEKYVTELAYDNPRFVEDLVREVYVKLDKNKEITWFSVEAENFESIHNHSAYAFVEKRTNGKSTID
ncbi:MAG: GTP cyclohydrolase I FolE2 [Proteobacteria bacterium]|nr:GTP cyclohydrolase I FolE2 [Pseudomonadota bacterium]